MKNTLALCMIVKDEEKVLERCLRSIKSIVDEIIIVDTGSKDKTREIAKLYTNKVVDFEWENNFSEARNFGLKLATTDYCLILDADERVDNNSLLEIKKFLEVGEQVIGRVRIKDVFKSNEEERIAYSWVSRIIPRGVYFEGAVHEQVQSILPRKNINIIIHHDGYLYQNKVNRNLPILLKELEDKTEDAYIYYQIGKQYQLSNECEKAVNYYIGAYNLVRHEDFFRKRLVIDFMYMLKNLKVLDIALDVGKQEESSMGNNADFNFVLGLIYIELCAEYPAGIPQFMNNIERCFLKCIDIGEKSDDEGTEGTGSYLAYYNLGVYHETFGVKEKAMKYYQISTELGYLKAKERLFKI